MLPAMVTGPTGGIATLTISILVPAEVSTVIVFTIVPLLPSKLTVTAIGPLVPGPTVQGCCGSLATVQPQEVRTLLIRTSEDVILVRLKLKYALVSPGLAA